MASNSDIKQHISITERAKWNKVIADFAAHLKSAGTDNHAMADGTVPGFSLNNYTTEEKTKLAAVETGALNNPHPATHPWTMIEGLANIAHSASWNDLADVPQFIKDVENGNHDAATVGGIRVTINSSAPTTPVNNKEIWIDTNELVLKIYVGGTWKVIGAAWR